VKIKKPQDLQRMLEICRDLLGGDGCDSDIEERCVMLMLILMRALGQCVGMVA
jgi:hypothetical protein